MWFFNHRFSTDLPLQATRNVDEHSAAHRHFFRAIQQFVATMQIKIAFLSSVSSACLNVWRCVATSFSWLYALFLCNHAFAITVVVKN